MQQATARTLTEIATRGDRLEKNSVEHFKKIKNLLERGTDVKEISYHLDYSRDYITHILEGMDDLGLIKKQREGRYYKWYITKHGEQIK